MDVAVIPNGGCDNCQRLNNIKYKIHITIHGSYPHQLQPKIQNHRAYPSSLGIYCDKSGSDDIHVVNDNTWTFAEMRQ